MARRPTRGRLPSLAIALAILVALAAFTILRSPNSAFAPPAVARLTAASGPLRIFPSHTGAHFVLPDGSLWRWGRSAEIGGPPTRVVRVGTDTNWVEASGPTGGLIGIRTDGTLWHATYRRVAKQPALTLEVIGTDNRWLTAATAGLAEAALQRDGTLWTAGASIGFDAQEHGTLGDPQVKGRHELGQVGTNRWRLLARDLEGNGFLGITTEGYLMEWGTPYSDEPVRPRPVPLAPGTNWIAASYRLFLERDGRLWTKPPRAADAALSEVANTPLRLVSTNAQPGRYGGNFAWFYEIRPDGSLWRRPAPLTVVERPPEPFQPCGNRHDWVWLWSGAGVVYGLTADGTVWATGIDYSREPAPTLSHRLNQLTASVREWLNLPRDVGANVWGEYRQLPEPQALLKLELPPGAILRAAD